MWSCVSDTDVTAAARAVIALILLAATPAAAQNESGQFPGVYVREGTRAPITQEDRALLDLKCALAPGVMHEDGTGVGYFLDLETFRASGKISYVKGQEYHCRYNAATQLETCESREFSYGKSLSYYRSNVYQTFTSDVQRGTSLLSAEDVAAWKVRGHLNPANAFAYHRCACITSEDIESRASTETNALDSTTTGTRLFWWNNDQHEEDYATARKVIESFKACPGNTS
jgi:hypothetical protein